MTLHLAQPTTSAVPRSIWAIGVASLLLNVSTSIIFGLSAVYMATLGVSSGWISLLEGFVEASSYAIKVLSGILSDYLMRRKLIMVWGFWIATLARPVIALSSTFGAASAARLLDRVGNGIQATPRDALVADLSPDDIKGTCFGLRQSLTTAGSFLGGIIAIVAMVLTSENFHLVFWIATIPAVLAAIILVIAVKEPEHPETIDTKEPTKKTHSRHPITWKDIPHLGGTYWLLMIVVGVFMLARVSEAMLLLHAHLNFDLSAKYAPVIMILYNGANSLVSYPIGRLSDRLDRQFLLGIGFVVLIVADVLLGWATNLPLMMVGVVLWGVQIGITQSMFLALVADTVPHDLRGTGFGFYYLISSVSIVLSNSMGAFVAHNFGEGAIFMASSVIACGALVLLMLMSKKLRKTGVR
ncbi:MAG: MFS transporter [Alphaproteobacteria bacterium]|nr:MFS transporter [Alphaproteobacteria bacterium]